MGKEKRRNEEQMGAITNQHTKRCSASLATRGIQSNTTITYHHTPDRMVTGKTFLIASTNV